MDIRQALGMAHHFLVKSESVVGPTLENGKEFLDKAVHLLGKGYSLSDNVKDLIEKYGTLEAVPAAPTGSSEAGDLLAQVIALAAEIESLRDQAAADRAQYLTLAESLEGDKKVLEGQIESLQASLLDVTNAGQAKIDALTAELEDYKTDAKPALSEGEAEIPVVEATAPLAESSPETPVATAPAVQPVAVSEVDTEEGQKAGANEGDATSESAPVAGN